MSNFPADVINEALMAAGSDLMIGEPNEGTEVSNITINKYGQCMRQILRAAHWDFARKMVPLTMLADATGQTDGVGTTVIAPWIYEYAYPIDCMQARFVPLNAQTIGSAIPATNTSIPSTPLTSVSGSPYPAGGRLIPSPFLISMDTNYPVDVNSNWMDVQGVSPGGRIVVLSNVLQANMVYTAFMPYPSVWPADFRAAMVAFLAAEVALPLSKDKKFGLEMRDRNMKIARTKVLDARAASANESGWPQSTDIIPDYIQIRASGAGAGGLGNGGLWGAGGCGWNGAGFMSYGCDMSVF